MSKTKFAKIIPITLITIFLIWTLLPIFLMFSQSVKPTLLMFSDPPTFFFKPTFQHFVKVFLKSNLASSMFNSIFIAVCATLLCLSMGTACAYSLSRISLPGQRFFGLMTLFARMVPVSALMMPLYMMMQKLGLGNTHMAVILAHTLLNLPLCIWLVRGFFLDIPITLEEAARVDGCTRLRTFISICVPLAMPGIITSAIMVMLSSWNEFMFSLILSGKNARTMPVAISSFVGSVSIDWGGSSAAAVLACIPILIVSFFIQKNLVRGLTAGAVKG